MKAHQEDTSDCGDWQGGLDLPLNGNLPSAFDFLKEWAEVAVCFKGPLLIPGDPVLHGTRKLLDAAV